MGQCVSAQHQPLLRDRDLMYHDETHHLGRPHFHAEYAEHDATIDIVTLEIHAGSLPKRIQRLVNTWADAYEAELLENWELARKHQPLRRIDPLP